MKNSIMELAQATRIKLFSEQGQPAVQKVIDTYKIGGINPLTGNVVYLKRESNQVVAFYCKQDEAWWISVDAGWNWVIMSTNESFPKVIHSVDIVL